MAMLYVVTHVFCQSHMKHEVRYVYACFMFVLYRKYITTAQLTQFMFMLCQAVYVYFYTPEGYPRLCATILFFYMLTMIALFGNFYIKQYIGAKNATKSKKAKKNGSKKRN